jgi:HAD superfamily phosphoserine phosphatase-like hydrolase
MRWLAVLDMDGTLLERRTVDVLCDELGLTHRLAEIDENSKVMNAYEVSAEISKLFSGMKASTLEAIFDTMLCVEGAQRFIDFLKSRNFVTAIVTDSYTFLASRLAGKLSIDAVRGNELEQINGVITGRIAMPLGWKVEKQNDCQKKAVCKLHAMKDLIKKYSISGTRTLAVGDSHTDLCVIRNARIGVAFRPKDDSIVEAADIVVQTDFCELIGRLEGFLDS